jgi:hypothetical protein
MTTPPTITRHNVLENRPLVQKLHCASVGKILVSEDPPKKKQNDSGVAPLDENQCLGSNATNDLSIQSWFEFYRELQLTS